jgi:hypothetical protein
VKDSRLGFSIQRPIFISLVVVALVLLAIAGVVQIRLYNRSVKEDRETITFGVTMVGAAAGVYGLLKAADSIRQANAEKFRASSLNFVERWNSPSYWQIKMEWRRLNEELDKLDDQHRDELLRDNVDKRSVAVEVLNFYEEMATSINNGSIDGELLRGYWDAVIVRTYERYGYWIKQHRIRKKADRYFEELQTLAQKWGAK